MKYETVREIHARIASLTWMTNPTYCSIFCLGYVKLMRQIAIVLSLNGESGDKKLRRRKKETALGFVEARKFL